MWVCVQVLSFYLCAHDSLFVNCPKLTFTSITTNISLTHTGQAKPFQCCPHWSLSRSLSLIADAIGCSRCSVITYWMLRLNCQLSAIDGQTMVPTHTKRHTHTHTPAAAVWDQTGVTNVCVMQQTSSILLAPNRWRISDFLQCINEKIFKGIVYKTLISYHIYSIMQNGLGGVFCNK